VDASWSFNDKLADNEQGRNILLILDAVLCTTSLIGYWQAFQFQVQSMVASASVIIVVGVTICQLCSSDDRGCLLSSAVLACYCAYLNIAGFSYVQSGAPPTADVIAPGIAIIILSTALAALQFIPCGSPWDEGLGSRSALVRKVNGLPTSQEYGSLNAHPRNREDGHGASGWSEPVFTYVTMALAALCASRILVGWDNASSTEVVWLHVSAGWVSCSLYLWALMAPKICPNREF